MNESILGKEMKFHRLSTDCRWNKQDVVTPDYVKRAAEFSTIDAQGSGASEAYKRSLARIP